MSAYASGVFDDVVAVQLENVSFDGIHHIEIVLPGIFGYGLRHSTDHEILTESVHCLPVHGLSQFTPMGKTLLHQRHQRLVAQGPQELLEIHGLHFEMTFRRGDQDVAKVRLQGHQRTGFKIMVPAVLD